MRRSAITGVGVVAPGGVNREAFWDRITSGKTATRKITFFDPEGFRSQIAAEADFDPQEAGLNDQEVNRMDRYVQFAVAAAMEAVTDAGLDLDQVDRERLAVTLGSAVGGTMVLERDYVVVSNHGEKWLVDHEYASPFLYHALIPSTLAAEVALKFGAQGPSVVVSTGCTSGIDGIGYGHQLIQDGEADIVIAGASETGISPISMACFDPIKATSRRNDDAEHASRPFDRDRDGFVMGEGSAILVLEEFEAAQARGAHIYCEVAGYANRGNAYHMTGLRPDGARDVGSDPRRDGAGRNRARGHRLHQRARLGDEAERSARDRGVQALAGRSGVQDPDQLHQVDDRALARRHRSGRDGCVRARHRPRRRPSDRELGEP